TLRRSTVADERGIRTTAPPRARRRPPHRAVLLDVARAANRIVWAWPKDHAGGRRTSSRHERTRGPSLAGNGGFAGGRLGAGLGVPDRRVPHHCVRVVRRGLAVLRAPAGARGGRRTLLPTSGAAGAG